MAKYTEWCAELETELAAPFPDAYVQVKKIKGTEIHFCAWHVYVKKLNHLVGGGWSMEPPIPMQAGGKLVVAVGITILGVTRWNVGDEDADHEGYGSGSTNAFAQGYKRACALFGMGLDMYDKKRGQAPQQRSAPRQQAPQRSGGSKEPWTRPMPFGKTKGTPLGDHSEEQLRKTLDWCQEGDRAEKFADLIADIEATLEAAGVAP